MQVTAVPGLLPWRLWRHRYSIKVYLDGSRKPQLAPPFTMGRKCGRTLWRGRDHTRRNP